MACTFLFLEIKTKKKYNTKNLKRDRRRMKIIHCWAFSSNNVFVITKSQYILDYEVYS